MPGSQGAEGLPVGSQIIAGFNRDRFVLRLAKHDETAYPAPGLWPALVNDQGME
jgi:Asp-tRNA(Asn)/Glu-tRNA(Gln) amidotransferase A subunit family amidase